MATNQPGAGVNPTVETVLGEVLARITAACAPTPIDKEASDDFLATFTAPFSRRLAVAVWDTEKPNVLNAADQHGIIAQALASLAGATRVNKTLLQRASTLVVDHCKERFGTQGIWCS